MRSLCSVVYGEAALIRGAVQRKIMNRRVFRCKVVVVKKIAPYIIAVLVMMIIAHFTSGSVKILLGIIAILYSASVLIKTEKSRP